ncbi:uncharacterized protein [Aquarana catesbeiana]|uniref:uncharacterized protein n=1 Tax=Aquarana catesbeiana TaxID=8400 RepID=UPI003CC9ED9B
MDKFLNMSHTAREDLDPPSTYFICKSPVLERRLMAVKYSETFKISSRAEASVVLKLTQQLSDRLEQYFLNCKGFEVLESGVATNTNKIYETSTQNSPSSDYGNRKLGSENRRLQTSEDPDDAFMSITNPCDQHPQPVEGFASESFSTASPFYSSVTESNFFVTRAHVYEPFQVEQNSGHSSCVSQITLNNGKDVTANSESKPPVKSSDLEIKTRSDLGMENNESYFDASSLHSSSLQETPSSSQGQRKTSKTLSPDILQLLKGKDANTVTNILKTLSPFYPALQDVNLEILSQVLVNTGALD